MSKSHYDGGTIAGTDSYISAGWPFTLHTGSHDCHIHFSKSGAYRCRLRRSAVFDAKRHQCVVSAAAKIWSIRCGTKFGKK